MKILSDNFKVRKTEGHPKLVKEWHIREAIKKERQK
jgi:hypothetical protein